MLLVAFNVAPLTKFVEIIDPFVDIEPVVNAPEFVIFADTNVPFVEMLPVDVNEGISKFLYMLISLPVIFIASDHVGVCCDDVYILNAKAPPLIVPASNLTLLYSVLLMYVHFDCIEKLVLLVKLLLRTSSVALGMFVPIPNVMFCAVVGLV